MKKNILRTSVIAFTLLACQHNEAHGMEWLRNAVSKLTGWGHAKQQANPEEKGLVPQEQPVVVPYNPDQPDHQPNTPYALIRGSFYMTPEQYEKCQQKADEDYEKWLQGQHLTREEHATIKRRELEQVVPYNPDNPPAFNPHYFEEPQNGVPYNPEVVPYNPDNPPAYNPEYEYTNEYYGPPSTVPLSSISLSHDQIRMLIKILGLEAYEDALEITPCSAQEAQRRFREAYTMVHGENQFLSEEMMRSAIDALRGIN